MARKIGKKYDTKKFSLAIAASAWKHASENDKGRSEQEQSEAVANYARFLTQKLENLPTEKYRVLEAFISGKDVKEFADVKQGSPFDIYGWGDCQSLGNGGKEGVDLWTMMDSLVMDVSPKDPEAEERWYDINVLKNTKKYEKQVKNELKEYDKAQKEKQDRFKQLKKENDKAFKDILKAYNNKNDRYMYDAYLKLKREQKENAQLLKYDANVEKASRKLHEFELKKDLGLLDAKGMRKYEQAQETLAKAQMKTAEYKAQIRTRIEKEFAGQKFLTESDIFYKAMRFEQLDKGDYSYNVTPLGIDEAIKEKQLPADLQDADARRIKEHYKEACDVYAAEEQKKLLGREEEPAPNVREKLDLYSEMVKEKLGSEEKVNEQILKYNENVKEGNENVDKINDSKLKQKLNEQILKYNENVKEGNENIDKINAAELKQKVNEQILKYNENVKEGNENIDKINGVNSKLESEQKVNEPIKTRIEEELAKQKMFTENNVAYEAKGNHGDDVKSLLQGVETQVKLDQHAAMNKEKAAAQVAEQILQEQAKKEIEKDDPELE